MWTFPWNVENTSATANRGPAGYYPATSTSQSGAGWLSLWDLGLTIPLRDNLWGPFPPPYPPWPHDSIPGGVLKALSDGVTNSVTAALAALQAAPAVPVRSTRNGEPTLTYPDGQLVHYDRVNEVFYGGLSEPLGTFTRQFARYRNLLDAAQRAIGQQKATLDALAVRYATAYAAAIGRWGGTTESWLLTLSQKLDSFRNVLSSRAATVDALLARYPASYNLAATSPLFGGGTTAGQEMALDMLFEQMRLTGFINDGVMCLSAWKAAVGAIEAQVTTVPMPADMQTNWNLIDYTADRILYANSFITDNYGL